MTTQTVNLNLKISDFLEVNNLLAELPQIVSQLESCGYECQAGRLEMNTAFIRMKEVLSELESGLTTRAVDAADPWGCGCGYRNNGFHKVCGGCGTPRQ